MDGKSKTITVFGSSHPQSGENAYQAAYDVGFALASAGYRVANGGYGGTMEASARGAAEAGGTVIGVTCTAFKRSRPNAFITEEQRTTSLEERLGTLVTLGDAYVVLPGGTGTLLELAQVWEFTHKGLAARIKPIVLWSSFWQPLLDMMAEQDPKSGQLLKQVDETAVLVRTLGEEL